MDNIGETLFCSTDREDCCTDEFSIAGIWFLPNGSDTNPQSPFIILGNQTVGLNITNSPELGRPLSPPPPPQIFQKDPPIIRLNT